MLPCLKDTLFFLCFVTPMRRLISILIFLWYNNGRVYARAGLQKGLNNGLKANKTVIGIH